MSATRLRVHTQSGSVYLFDRDALTWKRMNNNLGRGDIHGLEGVHDGLLARFVDPIVGEPLAVGLPDGRYIRTTPVVMVEDVT